MSGNGYFARPVTSLLLILAVGGAIAAAQTPFGSSFTYQGRLDADGSPVNDDVDLRFTLWDAEVGGSQVGPGVAIDAVAVVDGVFTVELDFTPLAFTGDARWLEITVASPTGGPFVTLTPRQPLIAAPYAQTATTALNAWALAGNADTDPDTQYLGTSDAAPLHFGVDGLRVLRLEPGGSFAGGQAVVGGNVIAGWSGNAAAAGVLGATIGGGGGENLVSANLVFDHLTVVGGGDGNVAGTDDGDPLSAIGAAVAGGGGNTASGRWAAILGGSSNMASAAESVVGGGRNNRATGPTSAVGGGGGNEASGEHAAIPGGDRNIASGTTSFAAGRRANAVHDGTYVWADQSSPESFVSTADNQYLIRATGGVGIGTADPTTELDVEGTVTATSFVGAVVANEASEIRFDDGVLLGAPGLVTDQVWDPGALSGGSRTNDWQSFTPRVSGQLGAVELFRTTSGAGTVTIYEGEGTDGAALVSASISPRSDHGWDRVVFATGTPLTRGQTYTIGLHTPDEHVWFQNRGYPRGRSGNSPTDDHRFRTLMVETVTTMAVREGGVGIGTEDPTFTLEVNGTAGKPGGGSWSVASDARLKRNVQDLDGALATLLALRGVTFEYKDAAAIRELPGTRVGFIAQEVERVIPDWVEERSNGYKALSIRGFEAFAVEAMRELRAEKDAEIAELQRRLARLEALLDSHTSSNR